jgi:hypothetical protein
MMTLELVRDQSAPLIDVDFQLATFVSLLGLTVSLALLPLLGSDFGTWLAFAG